MQQTQFVEALLQSLAYVRWPSTGIGAFILFIL